MDHKTLINQLTASTGSNRQEITAMLGALTKVIAESAETLDSVAIPSFGTFTPIKTDEEIRTDLSTGKRMLFPPQISIEFTPASSLRKKVSENHG